MTSSQWASIVVMNAVTSLDFVGEKPGWRLYR